MMVEVADLIDLVLELQRTSEKRHDGVCRISHLDCHSLMPGMAIEVAADQIEIIGPCVERVRCRMHTEEGVPGTHKVEQGCFLCGGDRKFTGREEHNRGKTLEVCG